MFNNFDLGVKNIETTFLGQKLILKNIYMYQGPLTMQYLPYGGIQMIYNNQMVIHTNIGYIATKEVEYNNKTYSIKDFANQYSNLVNSILPN